MRANEFRQWQAGAAGLEVPQRHVERGDRLGGDARAADRCAGPQQRLVDPVDVRRVLAERDVRDLREVGELGPSARALGVGEAHALVALLGDDLDEQQHRLGQRFLTSGKHLRVADRRLQRQDYMGKREVADAIRHRTPKLI